MASLKSQMAEMTKSLSALTEMVGTLTTRKGKHDE